MDAVIKKRGKTEYALKGVKEAITAVEERKKELEAISNELDKLK